jgi:hypothetical protein
MDAIQTQREIVNLTLKLQNELLAHGDSLPVSTRNILNSNHQMLINMIKSLPIPSSSPSHGQPPVHANTHVHASTHVHANPPAPGSDSEPESPDEVIEVIGPLEMLGAFDMSGICEDIRLTLFDCGATREVMPCGCISRKALVN